MDIETAPEYTNEEYLKVKKGIENGTITPQSGDVYYKFKYGALNPFEAKIILITYQINHDEPKYLKEWEANEKKILQEFFNVIDERTKQKERLSLLGFNITGFDIPFMFARMLKHEVKTSYRGGYDPKWLFNRLYRLAYMKDLKQMHLPLNDFNAVGLEHDAIAKAYGFPIKGQKGNTNTELYYNGVPEDIMKYVEKEFIYPQVFAKIVKEGIVDKGKFQAIVKEILAKRSSDGTT